ncbi:MAG: hypothetical protein AAGA77_12495 [Bacteroidota bacterium]
MKTNIYRIPESKSQPEITGKGEKGLLIAIRTDDKTKNEATLLGLVKAIKLDIEKDVIVVSCPGNCPSLNTILSSQKFTTVILIGMNPDEVGFSLNAKKYFIYKMESFNLLLSDSLNDLNSDKSKKMAFWQNLQALYLS